MAGWIGVNYPDGARLFNWAAEHDRPKLASPETSGTKVGNGQVEMELLRRTTWPFRRGIRRCKLEGQLERLISNLHLAPFGITDIQLPIQKIGVKGREGGRIGAVEHYGAQADRG